MNITFLKLRTSNWQSYLRTTSLCPARACHDVELQRSNAIPEVVQLAYYVLAGNQDLLAEGLRYNQVAT